MIAWLSSFLFTQLIEMPVYARLLSLSLPRAFGASALTHPIVWFVVFAPTAPGTYLERAVVAELFAWIGEAVYLSLLGHRLRRALVVSLAANATSLTLGLLARSVFGIP